MTLLLLYLLLYLKKKKEIEKGCDVFFFFGYYVPFNLGLAIFRIKVL